METDMVMLKVYTMRSMNTALAMTTHLHNESQIICLLYVSSYTIISIYMFYNN